MRSRAFAALCAALLATTAVAAEGDYEIGPADVLKIAVLGQPELSGEFPLDAEGMMTYPFLGRIKASALTAAQLEKKLATLLADGYLKRPQVSVTVKEFKSQKVYVTGEVPRPGAYSLKADRSLLGLLTDIGALSERAGHEVRIQRSPQVSTGLRLADEPPADGRLGTGDILPLHGVAQQMFRVSLREVQSGNPDKDFLLEPGDTVSIPPAAQVYVSGHVSRPGPYRFQEGMTVLQLLTIAGGVTERGSSGRVKVVRIVGGRRVEEKADLADVVQPEDSITVPERFF